MRMKDDVKVFNVTSEIILAIMVARDVYYEFGQVFTLTSLRDGVHSDNSKHYDGDAVDIRTHDLDIPPIVTGKHP